MADNKQLRIRNSTTEFLIFTAEAGDQSIEARYEDDTIWLTQRLMSELFQVNVRTISEHLQNVFATGELEEDSVIRKFRITASDGKSYLTQHYNLDAIISVGYRVNSRRATQFRQWATQVLRDYAIKGWVIDRERMENGVFLSVDYFERLLEEIREIRMSERRFYQKVTDIYATAVDYNAEAPTTRTFFASIQNKLHFAVHGYTAAELIDKRADADQPHMGLTSWGKAPAGKISRHDVTVAKNYLSKDEVDQLGHLVNSFLDLAESQARRHIPMTMEDWALRLDAFLAVWDSAILDDRGHISMEAAQQHAWSEFERFRIVQDELHVSDFDRLMAEGQATTDSESTVGSDALDELMSESQNVAGDPT
ncbi:MAG: virulence RhuM family protein [Propionibacteriaceae bacterium]|nr:virulence RhuM family protein [Propionibacteriaceae bacterium]